MIINKIKKTFTNLWKLLKLKKWGSLAFIISLLALVCSFFGITFASCVNFFEYGIEDPFGQYKYSCDEINHPKLIDNIDLYNGTNVKFTGIVRDTSSKNDMRILILEIGGSTGDMVYGIYDRQLPPDILERTSTVYGTVYDIKVLSELEKSAPVVFVRYIVMEN